MTQHEKVKEIVFYFFEKSGQVQTKTSIAKNIKIGKQCIELCDDVKAIKDIIDMKADIITSMGLVLYVLNQIQNELDIKREKQRIKDEAQRIQNETKVFKEVDLNGGDNKSKVGRTKQSRDRKKNPFINM